MMVDFFFLLTAFLTFLLLVGLVFWLCHRQRWRISVSLNAPERGLTDAMISRRTPQSSIADSFPARPNCFNGNPRKLSVELALRSRNIQKGPCEVELVSSLLEGNALLWLIACQESSTVFNSWTEFRRALARTFGPLESEEEDRLDLFSLRQETSLDEYITDFTRLSLSATGLDEHSRAILFVKGLTLAVQAEALREHPRTSADVIGRLHCGPCCNLPADNFRPGPEATDEQRCLETVRFSKSFLEEVAIKC